MADIDFDDFATEEAYAAPRSERMQKLFGVAGAITSAALVAGLLVWGYKLAVRDVTGIPVIRALEGPLRIAPENPGGELADHIGMAVNQIAADGVAAAPADTLKLAPPAAELAPEDVAGAALALPDAQADALAGAPSEVPQAAPLSDVVAAPALQTGPLADPLPDEAAEPILDPLADDGTDAAGGIATQRPKARPAQLAMAAPAGTADVADSSAAASDPDADAIALAVAQAMAPIDAETDPASLAPGTVLVQLGSFGTEAEARLEWDRLSARFGAVMEGRSRVIEPQTSGGNSFVRLRATGFDVIEDARRFCSVLLAENAQCVPTHAE